MKVSIPSKTFLLGEYCALSGGPSLVFTHKPCFSLHITPQKTNSLEGIHPNSPAGQLYQSHKTLFAPYHLTFEDPFNCLGGLGASSAQFLGVYNAINVLLNKKTTLDALLKTYWQYAYHNKGIKPSGADLVAQAHGGLCYFYPNEKRCEAFDWPFDDISLLLLHTKKKLSTHEHLDALELPDNIDQLHPIVVDAILAIKEQNSARFIHNIKLFGDGLTQRGLVAEHTQTLLSQVTSFPEVLAAKGAGAMGADIVMLLCHKENEESIKIKLKTLSKPLLATQQSISPPKQPLQNHFV